MKAITTKYFGATNFRGARIKAVAEDGNMVIISYPHELDGQDAHQKAAVALCEKMGWPTELLGGGTEMYVFVFKNQ